MCHTNHFTCSDCNKDEDKIIHCASASIFGTIVPQRCLRNYMVFKLEGVCSTCTTAKKAMAKRNSLEVAREEQAMSAAIDEEDDKRAAGAGATA
jgi:hypothetical protein